MSQFLQKHFPETEHHTVSRTSSKLVRSFVLKKLFVSIL